MPKIRPQPTSDFTARLEALVASPEVARLVRAITTCTMEWDVQPEAAELENVKGLELFPCLAMYFHRFGFPVTGELYPNLHATHSHLIRLDLPDRPLYLRLRPGHAAVLLSPFHSRFLSMLFGRLLLHHQTLLMGDQRGSRFFTPYSLEEQVIGSYLESLEWLPCANIKLDSQDSPYIGSLLHTQADLRRCSLPGNSREEAMIRVWRLFKRLLYYSIEGERLFTGFAFLSTDQPLHHYQKRWRNLLLYHEDDHTPLTERVEPLKQLLINADGRNTFLAVYGNRIIGLLELAQGSHRQLTTPKSWRTILPLATISHRGWINFWVALRGRQNPRIPLSFLEYRHGRLNIPLFQDIFWQELECQLRGVCPLEPKPECLARLKNLLLMIRGSGRGAIILLGVDSARISNREVPVENAVFLDHPVPLEDRWLRHFLGLAKSDGALIFNDRLEAVMFKARLKPTVMHLPPEEDDLGSGMRHQVAREVTAHCAKVLGLCISQDGHISLYRGGQLISRLY